jgi:molybdopterin-guanine dinucleotide biosynthesis protein A
MAGADKPGLTVGSTPMLVSVARAAASAGTRRLIIVGPQRTGIVQEALEALAAGMAGGLACVREEPPGGGPVAGLRRGLAEVTAPLMALLAADLPFLTDAVLTELLAGLLAVGPTTAGVVLSDDAGRPQWLAGGWRADSLRAALASYRGSSLHGLLTPTGPALLRPGTAADAPPPWLDCDTPADLATARRAWLAHG